MSQVVSFSLLSFRPSRPRFGLCDDGLAPRSHAQVPGIEFLEAVRLRLWRRIHTDPNTAVYAILATWPDDASATRR